MVEALIDTRLRDSLQFHDVLHKLRSGRGTGMAIMELKLIQELASVDHGPHFMEFLDLEKAYNTVDKDHLIQTLEGYRVGPHMCGLLETFCPHKQVVPIQNGYHGPVFPSTWGTTQGSLVSLTLFNVVVDNFIQAWFAMTVEEQRVAHNGLGETVGW